MRSVRVLSAFLFSISALIIFYGGFWYHSITKLETGILTEMENSLGGKISYSSITPIFDNPLQLKLILKGVELFVESKEEDSSYKQIIGDIKVVSDFRGEFRTALHVPAKQTITVSHKGKTKDYELLLDSGRIEIYRTRNEILLSANTLSMDEVTKDGKHINLIKSGYTYFTNKTLHNSNEVRYSAINLLINNAHKKQFDTIMLNWELKGKKLFDLSVLFPTVLVKDESQIESLIEGSIEKMKAFKSHIDLKEAHLIIDDFWITFRGSVGVDSKGLWPLTKFSTSTNNFSTLLKYLTENKVISSTSINQQKIFNRMIKGGESINFSFTTAGGKFYINNTYSGKIATLPYILGVRNSNK